MKNPENKTTAKSSAEAKAKGSAETPTAKKPAAEAPVVDSKPVETGSTAKAAASGGEVKPADSALLGTEKKPEAAAGKKPAETPTTLNSPEQGRLPAVEKPAGKPAGASAAATATAAKTEGAAKTEPAKPEPAKPSVAPAQAVQKTGFWPVALGGAVAAGLGAAAALWALPQGLQPAPALDSAALKQEILTEAAAAAETRIAAEGEAVAQRAGEAGAEAARQIIAGMPAGADTTPELQAALEAQSQQIAALAEKLSAVEAAAAAAAAAGADGGAAPELQQQMAAMQAQREQAAATARTQIDAALAEAQKLQEAAQSSTLRAEAVAAVAALKTALEEGSSTDAAVQQLQDAGVAAPDAVKAVPPTLPALQDSFAAAARAALKVALRDSSAQADGGTLIGNFLRAQTGARSVEPREGGDPDAVLSRADAAVQAGDLASALTELQGLPAVAREVPEMAAWLTGAEANVAARAALNDLAGQSN
ncbi:MAG: hypothetical protein ACK5IP_08690 [Paracoccus sp. (in: a-proteobacteria)]